MTRCSVALPCRLVWRVACIWSVALLVVATTRAQHPVQQALAQFLASGHSYADDPALYDSTFHADSLYVPRLSEPLWVVPSAALPSDVRPQRSNNNVSINPFGGRLYMAFRTGPTHFASKRTGMYLVSTSDAATWRKELEFFEGRDFREPYLINVGPRQHFYSFAAGTKMTAFEPQYIDLRTMDSTGQWTGPEKVLTKGEVHWEMKHRIGRLWLSSYRGSHYAVRGEAKVDLMLKHSTDGRTWQAMGDSGRVYRGGVSETTFEFDAEGNLWAVTRNEDGDATGFGSHVVFAPRDSLGTWQFPTDTDPHCYMSPHMLRHGNELYLIARRQLGRKPFGKASRKRSMAHQRIANWVGFSLTPKTTALYRIDRKNRKVVHVMDLPGAGDTAFPSIVRLGRDRFVIANYSSPTHRRKRRSWLSGQLNRTGIYLILLEFEREK